MKKTDMLAGASLFIAGLFMVLFVIPAQSPPSEDFGLPPSLVPMVLMSAVIVLSGILFLTRLMNIKSSAEGKTSLNIKNCLYIFSVTAFLFLVLAVFKYFGYVPGGTILVGTLMIYLGVKNYLKIIFLSLFGPVVIYVLIKYVLQLSLF